MRLARTPMNGRSDTVTLGSTCNPEITGAYGNGRNLCARACCGVACRPTGGAYTVMRGECHMPVDSARASQPLRRMGRIMRACGTCDSEERELNERNRCAVV